MLIVPLLFVGGGVTSKDAGLAFPDWPTSDGRFWNPPGWLTESPKFWEHGHRYLGASVGLLAMATVGLAFRYERRAWVRKFAIAVLGAIVLQGILGGIRVVERSTAWALVHGCTGQLCFGMAVALAVFSARWFRSMEGSERLAGLRRLCFGVTAAVYLQVVAGAVLRHFNRGMFLHVGWGILVVFSVGLVSTWVLGEHRDRVFLRIPATVVVVLVGVAVVLGVLARLAIDPESMWGPTCYWVLPTAHMMVGSVIFASMVVLSLAVHRMDAVGRSAASEVAKVDGARS